MELNCITQLHIDLLGIRFWGRYIGNDTWTGIMGEIKLGTADMGLSNLYITGNFLPNI